MSVPHTGRQPEDWTSVAIRSASRALDESFRRSWAGLAHSPWLGWVDRSQMELYPTHPSLCSPTVVDSYQADHFIRTSKPQRVGHLLPNEGALGSRVEEALDERALTILAKGTRAHALEADLLKATFSGQHAAPRLGCLKCLVLGRRLQMVQKPVVTTPTSRHCAFPPCLASLRPMATLQTTETQLTPCCHA
ncbi:hypothetical protein T08_12757 [Trichinella sp. T8]|nr:hypothetical protein T08_12757 [Trichinella sp. T8]